MAGGLAEDEQHADMWRSERAKANMVYKGVVEGMRITSMLVAAERPGDSALPPQGRIADLTLLSASHESDEAAQSGWHLLDFGR